MVLTVPNVSGLVLNRNIGCIEMPVARNKSITVLSLNRNIGCIEI